MATVLVVDDSSVDRMLVGGLLADVQNMRVQFAVGGADALEKLAVEPCDLVVTDLFMPGMDGLELVGAIRSRFPAVPVILMTSKGSEEIAVEALRKGASSYVPKRTLAQDLVETVRSVLAASGERRSQTRMLEGMRHNECSFELDNDCTLIPPLVGYLQESVSQMGLCDDTDRTRVGVAIEEALVNALYHGNLEVTSELRETDYKAYYELVERRSKSEPYSARRIHVSATMDRDAARIVIRDEGPGFDPSIVPDPTNPEHWEKVSGRGMLLMRTFMDEVTYNSQGNQVSLVKRRVTNGAHV